jgi:hypothetical protein
MTLLADDNGTSCFVDDNGVTRWVDDNGNELACSARTQRAVYISYIAPPAALAPPLDGLTPTAAWSLSRKLFTADAGAPFFTNTSGQVTLVRDQTGNSRAVGRTAGIQAPAVGTGGPSLRDCADFSTSGQDSFGGPAFISMWTTSTQYTCFSFIVDAYVTDDPTPDNNSPLWYDEFFLISGVYVRATGPTVYYTNHDGVKDAASAILPAAGTPFVVETMHAGGTISVRGRARHPAPPLPTAAW